LRKNTANVYLPPKGSAEKLTWFICVLLVQKYMSMILPVLFMKLLVMMQVDSSDSQAKKSLRDTWGR